MYKANWHVKCGGKGEEGAHCNQGEKEIDFCGAYLTLCDHVNALYNIICNYYTREDHKPYSNIIIKCDGYLLVLKSRCRSDKEEMHFS